MKTMKTMTVYGILAKDEDGHYSDVALHAPTRKQALSYLEDCHLFGMFRPEQYVIAKIEYTIEED